LKKKKIWSCKKNQKINNESAMIKKTTEKEKQRKRKKERKNKRMNEQKKER
jgi:hypothetical protein